MPSNSVGGLILKCLEMGMCFWIPQTQDPLLSQMILVHILYLCFFKIHFNIII
jgi:hypothetical protein